MRKCVLLVGGYGEVLAMVVGVRGCWARKEAVESERGGGESKRWDRFLVVLGNRKPRKVAV